MIAALTGRIDSVDINQAIIDVGGVGYLVFASARTLGQMNAGAEGVKILIDTHVREDHIHLYGFLDASERDWFRTLTKVQGVGARVALAILSALSAEEIAMAIAAQDKAPLTRADGVGPKLAARIVNELKDKAGDALLNASLGQATAGAAASTSGSSDPSPLQGDAVSALVNLGYGRSDAFQAVAKAASALGTDNSLDALIKGALKELSL